MDEREVLGLGIGHVTAGLKNYCFLVRISFRPIRLRCDIEPTAARPGADELPQGSVIYVWHAAAPARLNNNGPSPVPCRNDRRLVSGEDLEC